jgi:hypothetical protein
MKIDEIITGVRQKDPEVITGLSVIFLATLLLGVAEIVIEATRETSAPKNKKGGSRGKRK